MKALNEVAWKEMKDVPSQFWSMSHFSTYYKCDLQVNNTCETFKRAILEHRDKPIITLLERIKHYLTKSFTSQMELINKYAGEIFPRIQVVLEKKQESCWRMDSNLAW